MERRERCFFLEENFMFSESFKRSGRFLVGISLLLASPFISCFAEAPSPSGSSSDEVITLDIVEVQGSRIEHNPAGRSIGKIGREALENTDAFSLKDIVHTSPGVLLKQGNGPRDVGISIRGSGAKVNFAVRNIKMFEDWFPVTQSDGLSRTDLHDPQAYKGVDVIRGPSSSLYDNYALGGVVNFRSQQGRDINGFNYGSAGGSHNYLNNYVQLGQWTEGLEYSLFGSVIGANGYIDHSHFVTDTQNLNMRFTPDSQRTFVFKFLNNNLRAEVPSRLTLNQFNSNPQYEGETTGTGAGTVTATRADQNRDDRRTIMGGRYEYQATEKTGYRIMGTYDVKDINQTFGQITDNINPNFQTFADVTHEGILFEKEAKHFAGLFFNFMDQEGNTFQNLSDGNGTRGYLISNTRGFHQNVGARFREEVLLSEKITGIAGVGAETSRIKGNVQTRTAAETFSRVGFDRRINNVAPELALAYKANERSQIHGRFGMGYGIPSFSNLTTTPEGIVGNNTSLRPQRNAGFELGGKTNITRFVDIDLTGYYELFYNEFVTQAPAGTSGSSSYTANAPRSRHQGVEAKVNVHPWGGLIWSSAFTFNDHEYTEYSEKLSSTTAAIDRKGKKIPGVERFQLNSRLRYDRVQADRGFSIGGFVEANWTDKFYINNSNTFEQPSSLVWNANVHATKDFERAMFRAVTFFFDVRNVFNNKYIGSSLVVADSPNSTPATLASSSRAFFAGNDRSYFGGIKLAF